MRKNRKLLILSIVMACFIIIPSNVNAAASVNVSVPEFTVMLNGVKMENSYNQYPLIVYQDITYFPMTYRHTRFMGLKTQWFEEKKVFFVGTDSNRDQTFQEYAVTRPNKRNDEATIPTYQIAINTTRANKFLQNADEPYPVLNFRDITYFPLTWRFAVDEFGWEYSFDSVNGLVINSAEIQRPGIDPSPIGTTSPQSGFYGIDYAFGTGDYSYVGYPITSFDETHDFIAAKKGEGARTFRLWDQLPLADYFMNSMTFNGYGVAPSNSDPKIYGNIFEIVCVKQDMNGKTNILLKIDLDTGEVLSIEPIDVSEK